MLIYSQINVLVVWLDAQIVSIKILAFLVIKNWDINFLGAHVQLVKVIVLLVIKVN